MLINAECGIGTYRKGIASGVLAALAISLSVYTVAAQQQSSIRELPDEMKIVNLLVDYYNGLKAADNQLGAFYTPDGTMDVDGWTGKGAQEINAVYDKVWKLPSLQHGVRHYLISNEKIVVKGDKATADFLWTEISA